jgi:hypothetical protein
MQHTPRVDYAIKYVSGKVVKTPHKTLVLNEVQVNIPSDKTCLVGEEIRDEFTDAGTLGLTLSIPVLFMLSANHVEYFSV